MRLRTHRRTPCSWHGIAGGFMKRFARARLPRPAICRKGSRLSTRSLDHSGTSTTHQDDDIRLRQHSHLLLLEVRLPAIRLGLSLRFARFSAPAICHCVISARCSLPWNIFDLCIASSLLALSLQSLPQLLDCFLLNRISRLSRIRISRA